MPPVRTQKKPISAAPPPARITPASEPDPGVDAEHRSEHGDAVGAEPEECGVPKRHQPGEAQQQIETHGEDRENVDLGDQRTRVIRDEKRKHQHRGERDQARGAGLQRRRRADGGDRRRGRDAAVFDAEQALRPDQQHEGHRQIDEEQRERREIGLAEGIDDADQQAADERAAQASHPADHDHDERRDEDFGIHARVEAKHGPGSDAAERRERHADAEDAGEQRGNVGAETRGHGGIVDAGADHGAEAAPLEKQPQQERDAKSEADQEQPVRREHPCPDMHRALQNLRSRQAQHQPSPQGLHQIEEDEGEPEGQQNLVHVAALIERPHEHELHHDPDRNDGDRREDQRQPEAAGELEDRQPKKRAQHEERAVRQAHDVHQTEDQR